MPPGERLAPDDHGGPPRRKRGLAGAQGVHEIGESILDSMKSVGRSLRSSHGR